MHEKTLRFLSPEPLRAFRKPGRLWSLEGVASGLDATVWVQCYGTADPQAPGWDVRVLVFPLGEGRSQDLWFPQGMHFPHGLVVGLSADPHRHAPLDIAPPGLELILAYSTDAEIALDAAMRAMLERRPDDPHTVTVSLVEFLRSGRLGPIRLGMARAEILETLGNPDDWSVVRKQGERPALLKYGDIEFYFGPADDLTSLHADTFETLSGGAALQFEPWILRRGTPPHQVEAQLALHGIDSQQTVRPHDPDTLYIRTSSGVELGFAIRADEGELLGLERLWYAAAPDL